MNLTSLGLALPTDTLVLPKRDRLYASARGANCQCASTGSYSLIPRRIGDDENRLLVMRAIRRQNEDRDTERCEKLQYSQDPACDT